MKKLLLIQPGAFGDIFVCAPIAKWYADRGYEVHWPVRERFLPTLSYFDYVKPILLSEDCLHHDWLRSDVMKILPMINQYDKVINLADRGPHPTAQIVGLENFEQSKYRLAEVPFEEKNNLIWTRNTEKELKLFNSLNINEDYSVVHLEDSKGDKVKFTECGNKIIEIKQIEGYNIPDWYFVLKNASKIFCIESSIHQFIDGIIHSMTKEVYLLKRPSVAEGCRFTISNNWKLDLIGTNSRVNG